MRYTSKSGEASYCAVDTCTEIVSTKSWQECGWTLINVAVSVGKNPPMFYGGHTMHIFCPKHASHADSLINWILWMRDGAQEIDTTPEPQTEAPKRPRGRPRK